MQVTTNSGQWGTVVGFERDVDGSKIVMVQHEDGNTKMYAESELAYDYSGPNTNLDDEAMAEIATLKVQMVQAMTYNWRVIWRHTAMEQWQTQEFTNKNEAAAFKREKRRAFRQAVLQVWNARENRWMG